MPSDAFSAVLGAALVASLIVNCLALWVFSRVRPRHRHPDLTKRIVTLETESAGLFDELEKLTTLFKRRVARSAVAEGRAKKKQQENGDDLSDEAWVKTMNQKYATGWRPS